MPSKINPIISPGSKIWFIQNTKSEGPGYFAELLTHWKIKYEVCNLERGDHLPEVSAIDAVILLGGPMSVNDQTLSMSNLLSWSSVLLKREIACLGICLGLQVLVRAAGGKVVESPIKEIGLKMNGRLPFYCDLTKRGQEDPLFSRFQKRFPIFQLHGETVELTNSMQLLAKGKWCENQVVKIGERAYGFQGHLEVTARLLAEWVTTDPDLLQQDAGALLKDWFHVEKEMHFYCRKTLLNFLKISEIVG